MTKIAILQFANTPIENSLLACLNQTGLEWTIWKDTHDIAELLVCDAYILPSGSASLCTHPEFFLMHEEVISFLHQAACQYKPILGMGWGAFILIESGLIPGIKNNNNTLCKSMTLAQGTLQCDAEQYSQVFVAIELLPNYQRNIFTQLFHLPTQLLLPLAIKQGRFVMTVSLAREIQQQGLNLFQVISPEMITAISPEELANKMISTLPFGIPSDIACSNKLGNVLATTLDFTAHAEAAKIFYGLRNAADMSCYQYETNIPLYYFFKLPTLQNYNLPKGYQTYFFITPQQTSKAKFLQQLFQAQGMQMQVQCFTYIAVQDKENLREEIFLNYPQADIQNISFPGQRHTMHLLNLHTETYHYERICQEWNLAFSLTPHLGEYWMITIDHSFSEKDMQEVMWKNQLLNPFLQTLWKLIPTVQIDKACEEESGS